MIREQRKRLRKFGCLATVSGVLAPFVLIPLLFLGFSTTSDEDDCALAPSNPTLTSVSSAYASVADFVQQHEEAYLLSWKIGGFLPSASITQTMIENDFNFTNPDGTSLWKAHNMGGVKTSHRSDFTETIKLYGEDSVDLTGTKEGTNVGDNTGGAYAWFKGYNAGIVGKAEFMKNQTLYRGAINNTDGVSTLEAIAAGGWASDAVDYRNKLVNEYANLGEKFKWLDEKAIKEYGTSPASSSSAPLSSIEEEESDDSSSGSEPSVDKNSWELVVVNRDQKKVEADFASVQMVPVFSNNSRSDITVDSRIKDATESFLKKAISEISSSFQILSGYRSYDTQEGLYNGYIQEEMAKQSISREAAIDIVQTYSQPAGASEHMTGLAIDITNTGEFNTMSSETISKLETIGAEFGSVRRFKEKYKPSTGIGEEDWHFRYVGVEHAKNMVSKDISLEDYVKASVSGKQSKCGGSTSALGAGDFGALFDVPFTVSQSFGNPWAIYASGVHSGVDLVPVVGAPEIKIYAVSDGEVVKSSDAGDGYGNSLQHTTPDGRYAHYAHLRHTPLFKVGDKVKKGDQIGVMGTTGMSQGEHLHFEILSSPPYGQKLDPSYVVIESGTLTPGMVIEPRKAN